MGQLQGSTRTVEEMKDICRSQGISESRWEAAAAAFDITIIDGDVEKADVPSGRAADMTDAQVIAKANADRTADLGRYGMTDAMVEEQRRMNSRPAVSGVWDE